MPSTLSIIHTAYGDMFGMVTEPDNHGTRWFRVASASGPVQEDWNVEPMAKGDTIRLRYNYRTQEYMPRGLFWEVQVVRINQKSITVDDGNGRNVRVEL